MQFEELYYGVLVMVLCDKAKSGWFRNLVELAEVYGDRGYKEYKSIRQVVEGVISCVKSFNAVSRWKKGITKMLWLISHPTYIFSI
ncbi:MAG: hypothetical protein RMJ51_00215 [Candidatus Calescibacterium sp.]|nr:hypothetical protein [Candidatus Calescibacterium sp.]MCX7972057.1 hypothetical protein [bacterium]MDW8194659.1 hypothetical protein [Candidatus Calescibacterium sp.]